MYSECQIKDEDEIMSDELTRYNFRRFTPEEIQKKHSPFERTVKKNDINLLFQKKKTSPKMYGKTSLEDIMVRMEELDLSGCRIISNTPPFSPYSPPSTPMPELVLGDSVLKENNIVVDNES